MSTLVTYHCEDKVGVVTLRRPDKLNAINAALKEQLIAALEGADTDDEASVVLLEAEGRAFSVGFDIVGASSDDASAHDPFRWESILRNSMRMALAPWSMNKPVIAAVQGYALGGACELAMMCDLTIAADDAKFGEPEVKFSHVGPVMVMPWMIGLKRARELVFFGDLIDAKTALDYGMVNKVVPAAELPAKARMYAQRLALVSPEALRWAKRSINRGAEVAGIRTAIEAGVDSYISLYAGRTKVNDEFAERVQKDGLKAALAWREDQFKAFDFT
ncbi:enoyl-CoA hydratase/isomerase family protein [Ottowia thiooxydans]|uniref:enoyl-CoA hydratase/isomerase family protein n=1 Tax=Ottowia thiooxydans TaxID=219182 RepID=UPI00041B3DF2|nr:enoyl-CoA hydratase/isomerase family protein [Ottowia thiooxydans]